MTSLTMNRWLLAVIATAIISARNAKSFTPTPSCFLAFNNHHQTYPPGGGIIQSSATRLLSSASSSSSSPQQPQTTTAAAPPQPPLLLPNNEQISSATQILLDYDQSQQTFVKADGSQGLGGGSSALNHIQSLDEPYRASLQNAIRALVHRAHSERAVDSARGRIMLGFCASNAPEALAGLKSWVSSVELPRGMLHGMDVDGVPIPVEELGAVYVKYSTGGAMTFRQMRNSGKGFDALWRPGDALLETYDGDFRGVYLNVELGDGEFRQFGVLPTDLFMEEEEW